MSHHDDQAAADLAPRIRAMASRWRYAPDELAEALALADRDPAAWRILLEHEGVPPGRDSRPAACDVQKGASREPRKHGRCADCRHYRRTTHPHLGHCAAGEPEPAGGLWDSTWRRCAQFQPETTA